MTVIADPIHRLEREALARAIRHEERIRRLMRVYGYARWQAEQVETAADRIIAEMEEDELAERREAEQEAEFAAWCDGVVAEGERIGTEDGSGAGDWVGVVLLLALFLASVGLVKWAL